MERPENTIELDALAGLEFDLDAVDHDTTEVKKWSDSYEQAACVRFRLTGVVFVAVEDPNDGYRSSLGYLTELAKDTEMTNVFPPVRVKAAKVNVMESYGGAPEACELLTFACVETGKVILTVGTSHADDYYPSFVANFQPENMPVNSGVKAAVGKPLPAIPAGPWDWAVNDERCIWAEAANG